MKLYIAGILCLTSFFAFAQEEVWKAGKVITSSGDTLTGQILFEDWKINPIRITFNNGGRQSVGIDNALAFIIDSPREIYFVRSAELKYYIKVPVAQGKDPVEKVVSTSAFFELIYELPGIKLFRLYDQDYQARFFLDYAGKFLELRNVEFDSDNGRSINRIKRPMYQEELKQTLNDCNTLNTANVKYNQKSIIAVLNEYAACKSLGKALFEQEKPKRQVNIGVTVAKPIISDKVIAYAAAVELVSPRRFGRFSTILELGAIQGIGKSFEEVGLLPHLGVLVSAKLNNRAVSPAVNFGISTLSLLNLGAGISSRSGTSLMVQRCMLPAPFEGKNGGGYFILQLRLMIKASEDAK